MGGLGVWGLMKQYLKYWCCPGYPGYNALPLYKYYSKKVNKQLWWLTSALLVGDMTPWDSCNSRACSGWLNLKTWFLPKITLDPVFRVISCSILRPLTKQVAPGLGTSLTIPLLFSKVQWSSRIWDPTNWISWGMLASGDPTRVTPSLM